MRSTTQQEATRTKSGSSSNRKRQGPSEEEAREYWERKVKRSRGHVYLVDCKRDYRNFPADPLPSGFFLVHNQGAFCDHGLLELRAWVQKGRGNSVPCGCDLGGLKTSSGRPVPKEQTPKHYVSKPRHSG